MPINNNSTIRDNWHAYCIINTKIILVINMSDENSFPIFNLGADLLGAYYGARQQTTSLLTLPSVPSNVSLSNANSVLTPWDSDKAVEAERFGNSSAQLYRLLAKDYASIQNKTDFIDRRDPSVRKSDLDIDSKGLFTLYNAFKDLKTLAEFAGDPRTADSEMAALEAQFQLGFSQVKDFIHTESFDELTLLYGEKKNNVTTRAGLGKIEFDFIGPVVHQGELDDPISSLAGGETFTITITRKTTTSGVTTETTENIDILIPTVLEERTMETLLAQINTKIQDIKTTNDDGDEVPLFNTRFFAEEIETDKYAFRIKTDFSEKMSFSATDTEPSIYITGNSNEIDSLTKIVNSDVPTTSFITKLTDLAATDASREFHQSLFASEGEALLVPEKTALTVIDPLEGAAPTTSNAIATDSNGNFYTVGATEGRFANHLNTSEDGDAFLNKYDASGKLLWSRLVGSQGEASSYAITVDANDNIIVSGQADKLSSGESNDPLATSDNVFSGKDSFVVKYDNVGTPQWMYINDKYGTDAAMSVTTDANGDVYITGKKNTAELSDTILTGSDNAYVMKLNGDSGNLSDYTEIGASTEDFGQGIAVAADGNIIVATHENGNFVLQKLDKDDLSSSLWTYDYGDLGSGSEIKNIVTDGNRIYVAGSSNNSLTGGGTEIDAPLGGLDNFVLALDDLGASATADWTKFVGSDKTDSGGGITVSGGNIYLAGTTAGDVGSDTLQGGTDSFAMKINGTTGVTDWTKQLGTESENREVTGVAFATLGTSVLTRLGFPIGEFEDDEKRAVETQTTARAGDYFYVKVNGLITKKIEIKQGDTYRTLANRINQASFRYINATVSFSSGTSSSIDKDDDEEFDAKAVIAEKLKQIQDERNGIVTAESFKKAKFDTFGNSLRIGSKDGGRIEIIAGRGDKDALEKLGLEPTLILSNQELFQLGEDDEEPRNDKLIGGVFAFKLDNRFSILNKRNARFVAQELEYAIGVVQSAYRSLTYDPIAEQLKKDALRNTDGPVPPHLLKQISNYQDGLRRISAILPQGGGIIT